MKRQPLWSRPTRRPRMRYEDIRQKRMIIHDILWPGDSFTTPQTLIDYYAEVVANMYRLSSGPVCIWRTREVQP